MGIAEILQELPLLMPEERRKILRRVMELEREQQELAMCDDSARSGFEMLEELESEDPVNG